MMRTSHEPFHILRSSTGGGKEAKGFPPRKIMQIEANAFEQAICDYGGRWQVEKEMSDECQSRSEINDVRTR